MGIEVEEEYRSLFSLPSKRDLLIMAFVVSAIYSLILGFLLRKKYAISFEIFPYIESTLIMFLVVILFVIITLFLEGKEREILDFRRLTGLFTLATLLTMPLLIIQLIISYLISFSGDGLVFVSLGIGISYSILALISIIRISKIKALFVANSYFFTILILQSFFNIGLSWFIDNLDLLFLTILFFSSVSLITAYSVSSMSKDKGLDSLDAFRGFMSAWLARKTDKLEDIFVKLGTRQNLLMGAVKFVRNDGSIKVAWIISNVHPGPFLNVASADLPHYLSSKLEKKLNAESVSILHGTCSHYNNLTTSKEKEKLASIIEMVLTDHRRKGKTYKPIVLYNDIGLYYQVIGGLHLGIVFSEKISLDDISYELGLLAHEKYASLNKDLILCDAHSSLDKSIPSTFKDVKPWDIIGNKIMSMLQKATEFPLSNSYNKFLFGAHKIRKCNLDIKDGLGSDGVATYIFDLEDERYLIAVIDSNNLQLGLYSALKKYFMEKFGFKNAIFVTTDTHEVNAVSPKEGSYPIIDTNKLGELRSCLENSVIEALKNMEYVEAVGFTFEVDDVNILGEEAYIYLKSLIKQGLHIFKSVYNTSLALSSIIILLLSFII